MVIIYADNINGSIKKSSLEALSYGAAIAKQMGVAAGAIVIGHTQSDLSELGKYGVSKVHQLDGPESFDAQAFAKLVADVATELNATVIVFSHSLSGKALAPRVSVRLKAGLVTGAAALPDTSNGFVVKKSVFSGKAFAHVRIQSPVKIVSVNPNAFTATTNEGKAEVIHKSVSITPLVKVISESKSSGARTLTESEIVVSAGRGMKGPENWGMIEELADVLQAGLACSRPVADAHWRPHHEHVGQTGIAIAPNLYIAIGISGAIQHLAGVNRSKVIVVINKDPEAPFFKAADYGIVGDAFEVVPKLTAALKTGA
ncbi:MAG: electron transfer flavoprotein subunit alpha/FixB family protein [Bacteroidota bacterium]